MKIEAIRKLEALEEKKQLLAKKSILKQLQEGLYQSTEITAIDLQSSKSFSLGNQYTKLLIPLF